MKRLLTFMAVICGLVFVAAAQRPLVTLSHNGELSFFSNLSALESALDSAQNGDIIYLSEGKFSSNSNEITIRKRVSIVGCGYNSHILANLLIDMSSNSDGYYDMPLFDGVRLEKLLFTSSSVSRENLKEVQINKCKIRELTNGGYAGKDFLLDRCYIEYVYFGGASANNSYLNNCKVKSLGGLSGDEEYAIQIINCNIGSSYYCPRVVINSIISATSDGKELSVINIGLGYNGTHRILNSLFSTTELTRSSDFFKDNCYYDNPVGGLLDDNLDCTIDLAAKGYLGDDGTVVGVYGGEFHFSENPSVPTVDSENSSVEYDADANKLKVTITVKNN